MSLVSQSIIHFTKIQNNFIDCDLSTISGNAVKVYLVISRKTVGWQKDEDHIPVSQIQKFTGLSENTVLSCIKELISHGLILKSKSGRGKATRISYRLSIHRLENRATNLTDNPSKSEVNEQSNPSDIAVKTAVNTSNSEDSKEPVKKTGERKYTRQGNTRLNIKEPQVNKNNNELVDILIRNKLSISQAKQIVSEYDETYIRDKINQLEYLSSNFPAKIRGAGKYLYNSIRNNWMTDEYEKAKSQKRPVNNSISEMKTRQEHEKSYQHYLDSLADESYESLPESQKTQIHEDLLKHLNKPLYQISDEFYQDAYRINRRKLVLDYIAYLSFSDFIKGFHRENAV